MAKKTDLSASLEDYLEAILNLLSQKKAVRAKGIADKLRVRQPSVTAALRVLADKKLISYEPYGIITLTKMGRRAAEKVLARHLFLRSFLQEILGVEEREADDVACKLEHVVSDNVMRRLMSFAAYVEKHKGDCSSWDFKIRGLSSAEKSFRSSSRACLSKRSVSVS